jgi:hypothetical protein
MIYEEFEKKHREVRYPKREDYLHDMDSYRKAQEAYREETRKVDEAFKLALYKEYHVSRCKKREEAFRLAWDYGHSAGYHEIEHYFTELVTLIK